MIYRGSGTGVKLLKRWRAFKVGDVFFPPGIVRNMLVKAGIAEEYRQEPETATIEPEAEQAVMPRPRRKRVKHVPRSFDNCTD